MSPSSRRAWIEIVNIRRILCHFRVALLAEGVDRNPLPSIPISCRNASPSSRRAWIEIRTVREKDREKQVALLAEGVDRNIDNIFPAEKFEVALLAEGVDRNLLFESAQAGRKGAPPRGGGGYKCWWSRWVRG